MEAAYKQWIAELKEKIRSAQLKAAVSVNAELIALYWDLGRMITEKQTAWGGKFLLKLSSDLRREFPEMQGFSETNLKYCKLFYAYFAIRPQVGDELENGPLPEDKIPIEALKSIPR